MEHIARFEAASLSKDYPLPEILPDGACIVMVCNNEVCVRDGCNPGILIPFPGSIPEWSEDNSQYLGSMGPVPVYVLEISGKDSCPEGFTLSGIRELDGKIPDDELAVAGLAIQIADYNRTTRFCGRCGTKTVSSQTERAKICPACNQVTYARLSPAIIVVVRKGNCILLVRGRGAPAGRFSLVAGFVEPGETIEHAVHREVKEEAGVEIKNIRYMASEPWPFPNSLMMGFVADYAGGTVTPDGSEIELAGWFSRDNLPSFPPKISIAHNLIDGWITGNLVGEE
jgi:NAD+ diphosphatase